MPNGRYEVTLKFAELYFTAPNQRKFNVLIEDVTVLSSYDLFARGGGRYVAVDQVFTVDVTDGLLDIGFGQLAGFDNPKINALRVRSAP